MDAPEELRYTKRHIWVRADDDIAVLGFTEYLVEQVDEIISLDLPEEGEEFGAGDDIGTLETPETSIRLITPVSGIVEAVNEEIINDSESVFEDCYGEGWALRIRMEAPEEVYDLLTSSQYVQLISRKG